MIWHVWHIQISNVSVICKMKNRPTKKKIIQSSYTPFNNINIINTLTHSLWILRTMIYCDAHMALVRLYAQFVLLAGWSLLTDMIILGPFFFLCCMMFFIYYYYFFSYLVLPTSGYLCVFWLNRSWCWKCGYLGS